MHLPVNVHIVIPAHNRREITIRCLEQLQHLVATDAWTACVVDDGSTDGTTETILEKFPKTTVLTGDGNLFWTGAMEKGMRHAINEDASCCVWLNDDLTLGENAIEEIVALAMEREAVVSGQGVIDLEDGTQWFFPALYRGKWELRTKEVDPKSDKPLPVDTCRGNLVAIPRSVIDRIGYPDGRNIPHIGGDSDYGLRATAAGIKCLNLQHARFFEKETIRTDNRSWLLERQPIQKIWKQSLSRKGMLYPRMIFVYNLRHWGARGLIKVLSLSSRLVAITLIRMLVPHKFLLFCYARHSHAYRCYKGRPESPLQQ
jgi:GT2 family glycosyltransferase